MGWNGNAGFKFGLGENPKDLAGRAKVSLSKLPAVASAHASHAMMDGAKKYDPYNWRKNRVLASIYIDAAQRHLLAWFEGEENAPDSEAHHLGHAIACCGILLDAQETGNLVDDRPDGKAVMSRVLDRLAEIIRRRQAEKPEPVVELRGYDLGVDCQSGAAERLTDEIIRQDRALAGVASLTAEDGWQDWPASWPPPKDAA